MERRERLEWLRDVLVKSIDEDADSKELASLAKQLRDTLRELADLPAGVEVGDPVDDFTKRLADRRADAAAAGGSAKGGKPRRRSG